MEAGESVVQDQPGIKETLSEKRKKAKTNYQKYYYFTSGYFPEEFKKLTLEMTFTKSWI